MSEAASDGGRSETNDERRSAERRQTIDLVRAERGEPERRRLPRFPDPRGHDDDTPPDAVS